jgi:hypothetical protein
MAVDPSLLAAGGGLLGSIIGTINANKKMRAAQTAQDTASANALALGRNVLQQQQQAFSPFLQRGNVAGGYVNALLGIPQAGGGGMAQGPAMPQPQGPSEAEQLAYLQSIGDGPTGKRIRRANSLSQALGFADAGERARFDSWLQSRQPLPNPYGESAGMGGGGDPTAGGPTPQEAFDTFLNSTNYQFTRDEALRAAAQPFFARGVGQSGAAMRASQNLASNLGRNAIGGYLSALAGQQDLGFGAAGGTASAAGNYGNMAGNIAMQQGQSQGQMALAQGLGTQNAIANSVQGINALLGSSFGQGRRPPVASPDIVVSRGAQPMGWGGF